MTTKQRIEALFVQTTSEYTCLLAWFAAALFNPFLAAAILVFGLTNEHFSAWKYFKGSDTPLVKMIGISASETVLWIVWLLLIPIIGLIPSTILFSGAMFVQHIVESGFFGSERGKTTILIFSVIEGVGAAGWYFLNSIAQPIEAAVVLFVALFVEHYLQNFGK